jgi:alpha-tubulin suppressor-like RCC1 family protein
MNNNEIYGCGLNQYGQLGMDNIGSLNSHYMLKQIKDLINITQISTGYEHSLFLRGSDGAVFSCGSNYKGQLGIGNYIDQKTIQQVKDISGNNGFIYNIKQIQGGALHSLFLKNNGDVLSCGHNLAGELGINKFNEFNNRLQQVKNITNISQISTGLFHSLFLHNDGTVWGCGRNREGQLGIGNIDNQNILKQAIGATDIKQISTGFYHSLFLKNNGTVLGCGWNYHGQLGIGNNDNQNTLQQVKGIKGNGFISDIKQISASNAQSLFLKNNGIVCCCGINNEGQLGINSDNTNTLELIN